MTTLNRPDFRGSAVPPPDVRVLDGVPPGAEEAVARLYWTAFARKFRPGLGDAEHGVPVLREALAADRLSCAIGPDGTVLGVLGHYRAGRGAIDLRYQTLLRHFSPWSAPWRALLLLPLHREARPGELLLDGIAVDPAARGRGLGTRLLAHAVELARQDGLRWVRLGVVDTNPRARALYERCGFVAERTQEVSPLGALYGFRSVTEMTLELSEQGEGT
ncbi:GNAT family N-acetyltransferase [Archangium minus]|uniref:GNAT family N-acetyltransferase n=1 Tax=Archangium minus TaxID=83450 RepID=A0ABY9WZ81_9BACT|nr:GNAT family N-acetyltransferase [Archangium minus]